MSFNSASMAEQHEQLPASLQAAQAALQDW
jgi:hypothetical protein